MGAADVAPASVAPRAGRRADEDERLVSGGGDPAGPDLAGEGPQVPVGAQARAVRRGGPAGVLAAPRQAGPHLAGGYRAGPVGADDERRAQLHKPAIRRGGPYAHD